MLCEERVAAALANHDGVMVTPYTAVPHGLGTSEDTLPQREAETCIEPPAATISGYTAQPVGSRTAA